MDKSEKMRRLKEQLDHIPELRQLSIDSPHVQQWLRDTGVIIENVLGCKQREEFDHVVYGPQQMFTDQRFSKSEIHSAYISGLDDAEAKLKSMLKECEIWSEAKAHYTIPKLQSNQYMMYPWAKRGGVTAEYLNTTEYYFMNDRDLQIIRRWIPKAQIDCPYVADIEGILLTKCGIPAEQTPKMSWPQILETLKHTEPSHDSIKSGASLNIINSSVSFGNGAQHAGRDISNSSLESEKKPWWKHLWVIITGAVAFLVALTTLIINVDKIKEKQFPKEISGMAAPKANEDRITQLRPRIKKRVDELYDRLDNEKLQPWVFINAGVPVKITKHDGSAISYQGVLFTGSPRVVFWSDDFVPPFIEDAIVKVFDQTIEECRVNGIDPKPHLFETNLILSDFIYRIYNRMASIDSKLMSEGRSETVQHKRDVSDEINKLKQSLERHYGAALLLASNDGPDG